MFDTTGKSNKFFENFSAFQTTAGETVPTLDRTLDNYFERNFESVIEEWGLLTEADMAQYERKLDYLRYEVGRLVAEKDSMKKRADKIGQAIAELEGKI